MTEKIVITKEQAVSAISIANKIALDICEECGENVVPISAFAEMCWEKMKEEIENADNNK